jgi:hypothetical protein
VLRGGGLAHVEQRVVVDDPRPALGPAVVVHHAGVGHGEDERLQPGSTAGDRSQTRQDRDEHVLRERLGIVHPTGGHVGDHRGCQRTVDEGEPLVLRQRTRREIVISDRFEHGYPLDS